MAQEIIDVGNAPNDGTGDTIRTAFGKCNGNFTELYGRVSNRTILSRKGTTGDTAGLICYDTSYLYVCTQDYTDGVANIWYRVALGW